MDAKHLTLTLDTDGDYERLERACRALSETEVTIKRGAQEYRSSVVQSFRCDPEGRRLEVTFDGAIWSIGMRLEEFVAAELRSAGGPRAGDD